MTGPEMLPSDYQAQVAEQTAAAAARRVTGEAAQGRIVVVASGTGEIVEVQVAESALRELDAPTFSAYVVEAANGALDRADAMVAAAGSELPDSDVDVAMERFSRRMDEVLGDLDRISASLDRLRD